MKFDTNNLNGVVTLLNSMAEAGLIQLVVSSSAVVDGEPRYIPMDEGHPTEPENFYGYIKLQMER